MTKIKEPIMETESKYKMTITPHTAKRIKEYCDAIIEGYSFPDIPESAYTFNELAGDTTEEKVENYREIKFATGKDRPLRKDIRDYNRVRNNFGTTHNQRMNKILEAKLVILGEGNYEV